MIGNKTEFWPTPLEFQADLSKTIEALGAAQIAKLRAGQRPDEFDDVYSTKGIGPNFPARVRNGHFAWRTPGPMLSICVKEPVPKRCDLWPLTEIRWLICSDYLQCQETPGNTVVFYRDEQLLAVGLEFASLPGRPEDFLSFMRSNGSLGLWGGDGHYDTGRLLEKEYGKVTKCSEVMFVELPDGRHLFFGEEDHGLHWRRSESFGFDRLKIEVPFWYADKEDEFLISAEHDFEIVQAFLLTNRFLELWQSLQTNDFEPRHTPFSRKPLSSNAHFLNPVLTKNANTTCYGEEEWARWSMADIASFYLQHVSLRLLEPYLDNPRSRSSAFVPFPNTLIQAMWLALWNAYAQGYTIGRCGRCNRWLYRKRKRNGSEPVKYCRGKCYLANYEATHPGRKSKSQ